MITEANLIRVGALSENVGTLCKYRKFKGGRPIPSHSDGEDDEEEHELVIIDEDKRIDLDKGN